MVFLVSALVTIVPLVYVLAQEWKLRKLARRQHGIFAPTETTFSIFGISSVAGGENAELPWSVFRGCRHNHEVLIVFYANSPNYFIVARQKLVGDDWLGLVNLIRSQVTSG